MPATKADSSESGDPSPQSNDWLMELSYEETSEKGCGELELQRTKVSMPFSSDAV